MIFRNIYYIYKEPTQDNIIICSKIRNAFINYYNLVMKLSETKKNVNIKKDALICFENEEFAYLLDNIIKRYIDN